MLNLNLTRKGYPLPDPPVDRCGSSAGHCFDASNLIATCDPLPAWGVARIARRTAPRSLAICSGWLFFGRVVLTMMARHLPSLCASLHPTVPPKANSQGIPIPWRPQPTQPRERDGHFNRSRTFPCRLSACRPSKRAPQLIALLIVFLTFRQTKSRTRSAAFSVYLPEAQTGTAGRHTTSLMCWIDSFRDESLPMHHGVDFHISFPNFPMGNSTKPNAKAARVPNNMPIETFRLRGISASVFENQSEDGQTFYRVSLVRTYKDGNGQFQTTSAFSRDDLPIVAHLANEAWQFVMELEQEQRTNTTGD